MSSSETESAIKTLEALVKSQTLDLTSIVALKQKINEEASNRRQSGIAFEEARLASPLQQFSEYFTLNLSPSSRDSTLAGESFIKAIDNFLPTLENYSLNGHSDSLKILLLNFFSDQAEKVKNRSNGISL